MARPKNGTTRLKYESTSVMLGCWLHDHHGVLNQVFYSMYDVWQGNQQKSLVRLSGAQITVGNEIREQTKNGKSRT